MKRKGFWPWFFTRHNISTSQEYGLPFISTIMFYGSILVATVISTIIVTHSIIYHNPFMFVTGLLLFLLMIAGGWVVTEYCRYVEEASK